MNLLNDLTLAVAIYGYTVSYIREKIVATFGAESSTLHVCLQNLKDRIVFGPLCTIDNARFVWALI